MQEYVETLSKSIRDKEDMEVKQKIIDELSKDGHFLDWFKKHYDFAIVSKPPKIEIAGNKMVTTHTFGYYGPVWIPLKTRIERKILAIFRKHQSLVISLKKFGASKEM